MSFFSKFFKASLPFKRCYVIIKFSDTEYFTIPIKSASVLIIQNDDLIYIDNAKQFEKNVLFDYDLINTDANFKVEFDKLLSSTKNLIIRHRSAEFKLINKVIYDDNVSYNFHLLSNKN